jgi:hypothetical protein
LVAAGDEVLVVSSGGIGRLDELPPGWRAVADPGVRAMLLAGVPGTPSVAHLDEHGHVVSTAVGIHDVRASLGLGGATAPLAEPEDVRKREDVTDPAGVRKPGVVGKAAPGGTTRLTAHEEVTP